MSFVLRSAFSITRLGTLLGFASLGRLGAAQSPLPVHGRTEDPRPTVSLEFEGLVLAPDGSPAAGAIVVSSAGGRAVAVRDGSYRLEVGVPLDAETVELTAIEGGGERMARTSVGSTLAQGTVRVEPLVLGRVDDCGARWRPTFGGEPGADDYIASFAVFDDGNGPALYAGGGFTSIGGVAANHVARWDGSTWTPLGSGTNRPAGVHAMTVFDDGRGPALYAGGDFTTAGGVPALCIARWDGASWEPLGGGTYGAVQALAVFDDGKGPALYAGGSFTSAGGLPANYIARWDGSGWSTLGLGTGLWVRSLVVHDDGNGPALYAGGHFTSAGGIAANHIARWDGSSWSALGSGTSSTVQGITVYDDGGGPALFVGGAFTSAGGAPANHIAKWDGSGWTALAGGMNGEVEAMAVFDDGSGPALVSCSAFGGAPQYIARWNGSSWSPLNGGMNTYVHALAAYDPGGDPALFAGGYFTTAGQAAVSRFARWNGADWSAIGAGLNGSVRAVADFDDGGGTALHAAGDFLTAGGVAASRVARWDEGGWSPLGSGIDGSVRALAVHDDGAGAALHAGGTFTTAGGVPANHVARWDGSGWAPLGSGLEGAVFSETAAHALTTFDDGSGPALVVGGQFLLAGGVAANHIARWDGLGWSALGSGMSPTGEVRSLVVFDDGNGPALYVGGVFLSAGGLSAKGLARWDGASWSDVGGGVEQVLFGNPEVNALAVFDDGNGPALYAAGNFSSAGGVSANHVARWDGTSWSPLLAGTDGRINALVVFDDGGGPALFAGGEFFTAGGVASNRLARWTGSNWSPLAGGATDDVLTLGVSRVGHQDCLVAGGSFGSVPDWEDSYLALWSRPLPCLRRAKVRRQ